MANTINYELIFDLSDISIVSNKLIGKYSNYKIWLFNGPIGAGKTTFIKSLCHSLEVKDVVSSPTFSIINEYFSSIYGVIYHFDFYRLNHITEALDIGVDEYFNSGNICFVEWPSKVESLIPPNFLVINFEILSDTKRKLSISI